MALVLSLGSFRIGFVAAAIIMLGASGALAVANTPSVTDAVTEEDTQTTSGLVISRNAADGTEVTHFKITNITNGALFQNDGTTVIADGSFITFAEGNAGLKFTPAANSFASGSFQVQGATDSSGGGLSSGSATATITVNPVADTPSVTNATTDEDIQTTSGLVISRNAADGAEVTHFKITNITGGALFKNDGTTVIADGSFITFAEGNAGLKFTPAANSFASGSFQAQGATDSSGGGLSSGFATATITVNAVADTPSVTNATTDEDTQTTSGLVISRNAADGTEVTHFKISNVTGGTLFKNDGTTVIADGSFITFAEGNAGLKFTPVANSFASGGFDVQAAVNPTNGGLGGGLASATITVNAAADTPSVTDATTNEDTQTTSGLVISRNPADGAEVTHFKITNITNGTLFKNDGTTVINNDTFITFAEGNAGLKFTPAANSFASGSFQAQGATDSSGGGLSSGSATATITVNPVADTPSVTNATTNEDTQTTSGLVISRNAADGTEVTHFKISNITGGTLFKNDGTTVIADNSFITFAEGNAGLKFTPAADSFASGSFQVQGATDSSGSGLSSGSATATITVNAVADTPSVTNATTNEDTQTTSGLVISRNAADGTEVTHFKITNITNGTLFKNDGTTAIANSEFITFAEGNAGLKFTPAADSFASGSFQVQGATDSSGGGLSSGSATATITVNPVADTPSVTNAATVENTQTTSGLVVSRNAADGAEVTHFKISNITNGTLFKNDGTTVITDNSFITFAEGNAGLKFTPSTNSTTNGSFQVQASLNATNGGLGGGLATATITVQAAPTFAIDDVTQNEGDAGTTSFTFTITKTGATAFNASVDYETVNGTATEPSDFTKISPTTLVFLPADTSKQITVSVKGDTTVEPNEAFTVHLSNPIAAKITDADGTGTITNDDTDVTVAVSPASVVEDGVPNLVYTFTRTGVTSGSITVNFSVSGTATFPSDYSQSGAASFTASSGSVTLGDGITTATVTVDPTTDTVYESNETVILTVTSGSGYNPGSPAAATGTITNDDDPPTLAIGDKIAFEGTGSGTTPFTFTVTKAGGTQVIATVHYATADGVTNAATGGASCTTGVDYISQSGTLTFPASGTGSTSQTITVAVCKDATVEPNETFFVELDSPTDATISDGEGRGTIQNDDSPGTTLVVNTTDDHAVGPCEALPTGDCTLREAITAASSAPGADTIAINFAIPATDPRHFYYSNDGVVGQVTNDGSHVFPTSATDDTTIAGIDPDWPHSWWSILLTSSLPAITHSVIVDAYTQTGASVNAVTTGTNAVPRIELNGTSAGASATGLNVGAGTSTVRGLVINRFSGDGLALPSGNSTVAGNFIGTDVSGTLDLGNTGNGIACSGFSESIGGSTPAEVNLISGNDSAGISFSNSNSDLVLGNLIGTKSNGTTALGNSGNGISLTGAGSAFNTIGGTQATDGNTIANNGGDGVQVASTAGAGNAIRGNSIFSNGTTNLHLGIDLGTDGVTANDAKDPDSGPNNLQNFPIITVARVTGSTKTIDGTLNSTASRTFDIDFYASSSCDASGNGEGRTYLGSTTTDATDTNGNVSFEFHPDATHAPAMTAGKVITATATSTGASFNTSEFSACFTVVDGSSGAGDIQFTSVSYAIGEAGGTASITVTRAGGSNGNVSANFSTSDGTAKAPGDYTAVTNSITYAEGETGTKTVNIPIVNDAAYEGDETVNLALSGTQIEGAPPTSAPPHVAVLTITDNDPLPAFTIDDVTHNEGTGGTTAYTFTVTKTGNTAVNATVDYATVDGTATAPSDFTAIGTTTLTFLPADTTKQFTVSVNADATFEANEAFTVHLSNASNATIGDADGTGTITNDDAAPTVQFSAATYSIGEGGGNATITVTKTGATAFNATVHYATSDGSATTPADYTATSGDLIFTSSETSKQFTVPITDDAFFEGNENFGITLSAPVNATLGTPSSATVTIAENDAAPAVKLSSANYSVSEGGGTATITVTKTGSTALNTTVHYATADGTAVAPGDYSNTAGDMTFAPGETSKDFTVPITNDTVFEGNETFAVNLSAPVNATLGSPSSATVTIVENDAAPTVRFTSATYSVGEGGGSATVTVTKTGSTALSATVHYATSDGSATAPSDYTATSGDLTFAPGETSKDISIPITDDAIFEPNENFAVTLSAPGNATLGSPSSATVTITNNDPQPSVQWSSATYSVNENGGNAVLTATRNGASASDVIVHYSTSDGTAKAGSDYTAVSGDLTFPPGGPASQSVNVPIVDDSIAEGNETFTASLSAVAGGSVGSPQTATVTIVDNEAPTPTPTPTPTPSPTATPTPTPAPTTAQALNISTRLRVDVGDKVMIGGFIITGNGTKPVILRGMGPSLAASNIPAALVLADPILELRGANGALIMQNDNWKDSPQRSQFEGTPFQPTDDRESVILATLPTGNYTAILTGKNQTTGIGLVEVYDNGQSADPQMANISTRGFVQAADNVMIGGFILGGSNNPARIAVRGIGPSLAQFFGANNVLADPTLELRNANGTLLISNDNWQDDLVSAAQLTANGLQLSDPKEAGIFTSLPPGQFTAILAGKSAGTGIGLLEIYNVK